jgi:sec-independent protein translocase protein TatB
MFDFSFGKLILIFALCLIVLGPEKLPKLAAQLGRFAGQARAMARHFRSQLEQEIAADDLKKELLAADEAIAKIAAQTSPIHSAITEATNSASNLVDTHVADVQAAAEAATKPLDIAGLNANLDAPVAPVSNDAANIAPPDARHAAVGTTTSSV